MASKQLIISVSREFGSGGHEIAEILSKKFDLPLYDSNILMNIAADKNLNHEELAKYDEMPKMKLFSRNVKGFSNSPEENIAEIQFEYLRKKAAEGESFVVVGRCAAEILKEFDCLVTVFILGDMDKKVERIMNKNGTGEIETYNEIIKNNKKRKAYHNYYCKTKWGDSRNYELSVNSSKLGIVKTADFIESYIRQRFEMF